MKVLKRMATREIKPCLRTQQLCVAAMFLERWSVIIITGDKTSCCSFNYIRYRFHKSRIVC
ncbi:MAG: hypothetical protein ACI9HU_001575 [Colwellia sp.]|jgi:hypothetical protein